MIHSITLVTLKSGILLKDITKREKRQTTVQKIFITHTIDNRPELRIYIKNSYMPFLKRQIT